MHGFVFGLQAGQQPVYEHGEMPPLVCLYLYLTALVFFDIARFFDFELQGYIGGRCTPYNKADNAWGSASDMKDSSVINAMEADTESQCLAHGIEPSEI